MKLELKHLAPYLPYNLNIQETTKGSFNSDPDVVKKETLTPSNISRFLGKKPILRPLSDLTKEITVKGETFIPIYKLFELEYKGTTHCEEVRNMYFNEVGRFIESSHISTGVTTSVNVLNPNKNNYWKIKKLHEWHFDTNSLINEGLAIDINDL